jgi:hypothetical protein
MNTTGWLVIKNIQVSLLLQARPLLQLRQGRSGQELKPQAVTRRSNVAALAVLLSEVCGFALKVIKEKSFKWPSGRR